MHRLFTAAAIIVSTALISMSADARPIEVRELNIKSPVDDPEQASVEPKHKDWINLNKVTAIRWAPGVESRNVKVRGRISRPSAKGRAQHGPIKVIKPIDKATPLLARAAKTRQRLPLVLLLGRDANGRYMEYKLEDVLVTSYQTGGSAGDTVPMEMFSLNF